MDSDDRLADNAIENLYSAITSYKADICYGGIRLFGIGKEQELYHCGHISILDSREACRRMFLHDGLDSNTFAKIYKAELWADVRFPEGTIFEDVPIMYKIVLKSKKNVIFVYTNSVPEKEVPRDLSLAMQKKYILVIHGMYIRIF